MDVQTIDATRDDEVARWAAQLGVSPERLRAAIAAVGNDVDKVKAYLVADRSWAVPPAP